MGLLHFARNDRTERHPELVSGSQIDVETSSA